MNKGPNILLLDFETAPALGYFWGSKWETDIIEIVEHGYLLSASMKWLEEDRVYFYGLPDFPKYKKGNSTEPDLLRKIVEFIDKADWVVAHNGDRFDLITLNTRLLYYGMKPCPPRKSVDTLKAARSKFKLSSNKLDDIANFLGIARKVPHTGKHMWFGCMNGVKEDWAMMKKYNAQDVRILEEVYLRVRPFIDNHPNWNVYSGSFYKCPRCGSSDVVREGIKTTISMSYQAYSCKSCGRWSHGEPLEKRDKDFVRIR